MDNKPTIHENKCVENFMKNLNIERNNKRFCDLTIKANDGETFLVHKIVVCAASSFFKTLFNTNFPDKESDVIELSKIPSDVLIKLIEFIYGEKIVTHQMEEIRNVLDGALFLGLYNLVDSCTEALMKIINETNKFELLNYAETYINIHGEKLAKKCLKFVLKDDDFQTIIKSEDFLQLSFDTIKFLVSIGRNELINEETLFLSLIEWISYDIVNREQYFSLLINQIHFDRISNEFLLKIYKNYDNLHNNNDFLRKIIDSCSDKIESLSLQEDETESLSLEEDETENLSLSSIDGNIYAVIDNEMVMLDPYEMDFSKFITDIDRVYFGYTNFKNEGIFLCGGKLNGRNERVNTCKYFSLHTNKIHELLPMQYAKSSPRAVTLNDQFYVCGGLNKRRNIVNKSIEIFDTKLNYWRNGCNWNRDYFSFGLCTLDGSIYATRSNYLERFDPRESCCTILSENDRESGYCVAVGYYNFIYKFDEFGCRKFDIRQNKWINYDIKIVGDVIIQACIVDNEIYAVDRNYNLFHLNCENDSIIKKYELKGRRTSLPHALLFM